MIKSVLVAVTGAVIALGSFATPSLAQSGFRNDRGDLERMQNTMRQLETRTDRRNDEIASQMTPAEAIAAAQALATGAGLGCQVTQASYLGSAAEDTPAYEAACATGPGYILVGSTPTQGMDCVRLAGQAEMDRAGDPAANVGVQCVIPQNVDILRVVGPYATEAAVPCAADQGAFIGKSGDNPIYEVGCAGADGYWIERQATGWKKTECAVVLSLNGACRFSTASEQAATLKSRLVDTEAAACDVTASRYIGSSGGSGIYEAKCSAGNGMILRFSPSFALQQIFPCETAQAIAGGCRLTTAPAAPAG